MGDEYPILAVEEAVARFLSHFRPLESERTPILDALGRVLAEDVVARDGHPAPGQHCHGRLRPAL